MYVEFNIGCALHASSGFAHRRDAGARICRSSGVPHAPAAVGALRSFRCDAASAVNPRLLHVSLGAVAGETRISLTDHQWTPNGRVRYSVVNLGTLVRSAATTYTATGTSDIFGKLITGLTIGAQYRLDYWLDCIPNIDGYTEGWKVTTLVWTQPAAGGGDINDHYVNP